MREQKGYTLVEVAMVIALIACVVIGGVAMWVVSHFIIKYW